MSITRIIHDAPQTCPAATLTDIHWLERLRIVGDTITAEPCGHRLTPVQGLDVMDEWDRLAREDEL